MQATPVSSVVHTRVPFHFTVQLAYEDAAPLFGAWAERKWEPNWNPTFLFPDPPADQEGAVFTIPHEASHDAVWVNTAFDLTGGHVQYVVFQAPTVVTRIDIRLSRGGEGRTDVAVAYERTALDPGANGFVRELEQGDREKAPAWQKAIDAYALTRKGASR